MATILCLDDEPAIGLILQDTLERAGHQTVSAHNVPQALQALAGGVVDLIISDYRMPGLTGLEFLALLRQEGYETPLIMLTGYGEHRARGGGDQGRGDRLHHQAGAPGAARAGGQPGARGGAAAHARTSGCARRSWSTGASARSSATARRSAACCRRWRRRRRRARRCCSRANREPARSCSRAAIHAQSDRRDGPFIKLNCAALPEGLIESALFGHEKGAFTGAIKRVEGAFERANGGTLLLDEISEMRLDLQAKLLRVLQEQEFERVGGSVAIKVDVRIVATTNRDLAAFAAAGQFRQDLYYRLSVIPVRLPPLRERKEDIAVLAYRFATHYAQEIGKEITGISPQAIELLQQYDWPGNVRELQHAVERAVILTGEPMLPVHAFDGQRFRSERGLERTDVGPTLDGFHEASAGGDCATAGDSRRRGGADVAQCERSGGEADRARAGRIERQSDEGVGAARNERPNVTKQIERRKG